MQVFNAFFKVVRKGVLPIILIYLMVFLPFAFVWGSESEVNPAAVAFKPSEARVAIIDRDESELSKKLVEYLHTKTQETTVADNEEAFTDAMFYGDANMIVIIPEGFGDGFMSGSVKEIETLEKPDSTAAMMVSSIIDGYLSTAGLYLMAGGEIDYDKVTTDMNMQTEVTVLQGTQEGIVSHAGYYMKYLAYPLLAVLIFSIGLTMSIFNSTEIRRRNFCAPVKSNSYTVALFLGNGVVALVVYAVLIILCMCLYPNEAFSAKNLLWYLNALLMGVAALSVGYFLSLVSKPSMITLFANVIPLGCSFLGGVFVPQEYLSDTVKTISIINPVYWYVEATSQIEKVSIFTLDNMQPALFNMLKIIIFTVLFFSMSLVVVKKKRTSAY